MPDPSTGVRYTRAQLQALELLARGGARYGTRIEEMRQLKDMGLCYAHDKGDVRKPGSWGSRKKIGRWTWRPTPAGWDAIKAAGFLSPTPTAAARIRAQWAEGEKK